MQGFDEKNATPSFHAERQKNEGKEAEARALQVMLYGQPLKEKGKPGRRESGTPGWHRDVFIGMMERRKSTPSGV